MLISLSTARCNDASTANVEDICIDRISKCLCNIDSHLKSNTYLVGERVSIADICTYCAFFALYSLISMSPKWIKFPYTLQNLRRWFLTISSIPALENTVKETVVYKALQDIMESADHHLYLNHMMLLSDMFSKR